MDDSVDWQIPVAPSANSRSGAASRVHKIERLKWSLWHGQVDKALGKIDELATSIEPFHETYARFPRLVKALSELRTYISGCKF